MRGLKELPSSYFNKFKDKKVKIVPFDPKYKVVAQEYIKRLNKLLKQFEVEVFHRGSTSFGIAGKGEIEIGVFPKESNWAEVITVLTREFGQPGNLEENYARFNDVFQRTEIEVIAMKGRDAYVDRVLNKYLLEHPELLKEYEEVKIKNSNSKKDYMIQKDKFFRKVIEMIPEGY
ncbi:GrpB family protein [Patescibacteria group bacterium]